MVFFFSSDTLYNTFIYKYMCNLYEIKSTKAFKNDFNMIFNMVYYIIFADFWDPKPIFYLV